MFTQTNPLTITFPLTNPKIIPISFSLSPQYHPNIIPIWSLFSSPVTCPFYLVFHGESPTTIKPSSSPSSPSSGFADRSGCPRIPGCEDRGEDRDEDRRQHHDPHRRQNGCESKWKTDVGPQIEMSSLVLTIQLLGYLIFTHTQNLWKPSERSESGGNNFFLRIQKRSVSGRMSFFFNHEHVAMSQSESRQT